ncbi:MAG: hypothetical protein IT450_20160 [Phycisphaerales bacterium]|nr:hypothetical protein [Phycisphaerales bacterium]
MQRLGHRIHQRTLIAAVLTAASLLTGCASRGQVQLTSFKDPYFPENQRIAFDECVFRKDGGGDFLVVGYLGAWQPPGMDQPVEQWLEIRTFWQPKPGKTRDDPSGTTATLRLVLADENGCVVYTGAGFVFPSTIRFSKRMEFSIEGARLSPDSTSGSTTELLGEIRLQGKITADPDDHRAIDLSRQVDLLTRPR